MKTIIEPFRIKSVEPINLNSIEDRKKILDAADYNLFLLKSKDVIIDLLTDSATGAMSAEQWAGIMRGDESYAGSNSFNFFESTIKDYFGFQYVGRRVCIKCYYFICFKIPVMVFNATKVYCYIIMLPKIFYFCTTMRYICVG